MLGIPVILLNPLQTHLLKKKAVRKVETDPIDAARIAQAFYLNGGNLVPSLDPLRWSYEHFAANTII